jgi:uncharacterized phosphatase
MRVPTPRDFGKGSGLTFGQWAKAFPDGRIPGRESDDALEKRVYHGLSEIAGEYPGKKILVVSHGAAINALLKKISGGKVSIGEGNLKNGSLNVIEYDGTSFKVNAYNA